MSRAPTPLPLLLLLSACADVSDVTLVLPPDPAATGDDGGRGPFGVARATYRAQARVSDTIRFEATWPATDDGTFDPAAGPAPCVLSVQGGLVTVARYRWIADHLASRGYVVLAPEHRMDLAIFEPDNIAYALDEALERTSEAGDPLEGALVEGGPVAAMGHSLGGVVAAMNWADDPRIGAVALFASYPSAATDVESMAGHPSLLLTGSRDQVPPEDFFPEWARFPEPRWAGVVDGMSHYDWTDDATAAEREGDGTPTRPAAESRLDAWRVIDTWFDASLLQDPAAQARLDAGEFPGVAEHE